MLRKTNHTLICLPPECSMPWLHFFAEMLNVVLVRQLGASDSFVWIIAVSELSIIGISLFPGKYLYTNKIAKQKIQKYDWWKGCLTILICSIVVRCLFQKISPLISDDHKLIYSIIIIIMIVGIMFQIVNWMIVFRFVAEKTNGKSWPDFRNIKTVHPYLEMPKARRQRPCLRAFEVLW